MFFSRCDVSGRESKRRGRVENGAAECGVLDEEKDHPGRMRRAFIHMCVCVRGSYRVTHCVQLGKGKARRDDVAAV